MQLLFLEKKQCHTLGDSSDVAIYKCLEQEQQCKRLSYVFEEVHHKGTLLERVALLENRVIQVFEDSHNLFFYEHNIFLFRIICFKI